MELITKRFPPGTKQVVVAPLGDIQWAGRRQKHMLAYNKLRDHINRCIDLEAWWVGMGDFTDFASPSNRERLRQAVLYDTAEAVIEDKGRELVDELYHDLLRPTNSRWLGYLEGHHFTQFGDGSTSDHYLCHLLKAPFLGTAAIIDLRFATADGSRTYGIWAHHGCGSSQYSHGPILKLEQHFANWEDVDLMLMGHQTKRVMAAPPRLGINRGGRMSALTSREVKLVGTGGWTLSYPQGSTVNGRPRGPYPEINMMKPIAPGAPMVRITPKIEWLSSRGGRVRPARRLWTPVTEVID